MKKKLYFTPLVEVTKFATGTLMETVGGATLPDQSFQAPHHPFVAGDIIP